MRLLRFQILWEKRVDVIIPTEFPLEYKMKSQKENDSGRKKFRKSYVSDMEFPRNKNQKIIPPSSIF